MNVRAWIEAMRLRTLPVSIAGVVAALGYARLLEHANVTVFILCILFAVLAQIASNFANEYYDFKAGRDIPGRQGPRRGVTEGDITPEAMKRATLATLAAACAVGLSLFFWGGWVILVFGIIIVLGVFAYSAGPFPLSSNGLGEVAVIAFFGVAPVCLTFFLMCGYVDTYVVAGSIAIGLMGANVLLVNNIRDEADDRAVRKNTIVVLLGRRTGSFFYLVNGWVAVWLMGSAWMYIGRQWWIVPAVYLFVHTLVWYRIDTLSRKLMVSRRATSDSGKSPLNPFLGMTACLMAVYALLFAIAA